MNALKARLISILLLASLLGAALPVSHAQAWGVIYRVTPGGGILGRRCGGSWAAACTLQGALSLATEGDEIWVAKGTHKPTATRDRTISFTLKSGVALYGGFAGNETARDQRDPAVNVTILSGDIGFASDIHDNSYHVLVTSGTNSATVVEGVTITGGFADGSSTNNSDRGGGVLNLNGSPTLRNITINENYAEGYGSNLTGAGSGAGMYSIGDPAISNAIFSANVTGDPGRGGGMYSLGKPQITDVTFRENWSSVGGGMHSKGTPTLMNVTFSGNGAQNAGGMLNGSHTYGTAFLTNVTFSDNVVCFNGAALYNAGDAVLTNVTISGNIAQKFRGGGVYQGWGNLILINTILWGNTALLEGPQLYVYSDTATITYSVVEGGCPANASCSNIITSDPRLATLNDNGGFTQTMALLPGSYALDTGAIDSCPATDQRGARRSARRCDIGAYELLGPVGAGTYDDSDLAWLYNGMWTLSQGTGTYRNTVHSSNVIDSYAQVTFRGTQVKMTYLTGPDNGWLKIYLDDRGVDAVNTNTLLHGHATWASPVVSLGVHTIRFEVADGLSGVQAALDAIEILGADILPPGDVTGFTAFSGTVDGSVELNWIAPADDAGDNASGPVTAYLVKYSTTPFASWSDGTAITSGLPVPATPGSPQTMTVSSLNPGTLYYFAIRAQDEQSNLSVNYATANATAKSSIPAVGPGTYDDPNAAWSYSGTWLTGTPTNAYNKTLHYSNVVGSAAQLTFSGTQFTFTYVKSDDRGQIQVYVDNNLVGTIDAYSTDPTLWQATWTSPTFTSGIHTVRFVHAGPAGKYIDIDAITIMP